MEATYLALIVFGLVLGAVGCGGLLLGGWAAIRSPERFFRWVGNLREGLWVLALFPCIVVAAQLVERRGNLPGLQRPWMYQSCNSFIIPVTIWFMAMFVIGFLVFRTGCPEKVRPWPLHFYGKVIAVFAVLSLIGHLIGAKTNRDFASLLQTCIFSFWLGANSPRQGIEAQKKGSGTGDSGKASNPIAALAISLCIVVALLVMLVKDADPGHGRRTLFQQATGLTSIAYLSEELIALPGHRPYWRMSGEGQSQGGGRQRWTIEIEPSTGRVLSRRQDDP